MATPLDGVSVAFVHPPIVLPPNFVNYPTFASLGLLYAAGQVERLGARVQVVDSFLGSGRRLPITVGPGGIAVGDEPRQVAEQVCPAPDVIVVGASMFAHPGRLARTRIPAVLAALARRHPRAALVLADTYVGGLDYIPYDAAEVLRRAPRLDAVCLGEGESALPGLLGALAGRRPFQGLPRAVWRAKDGIRRGPAHGPLAGNLDDLVPAFHLLDMELYFRLQLEGASRDLIHEVPQGGRFLPLVTSRGCPFRCVFCATGFGHRWRACSSGAVLRQVAALRRRWGVERFFFMDDCINAGRRRFETLAHGLAAAGTAWEAPNGFRADRLSGPAVRSMARAGVAAPSLSAESGDPVVVSRLIHKGLEPSAVVRAAGLFARHGMPPRVHFVIGFPRETRPQINRTLELAATLFESFGAEPRLQFATPVPGTPLYREARASGAMRRDTAELEVGELFTGRSVLWTPSFGPRELRRFAGALARRLEQARHKKALLAPSYRCNSRCTFCCTDTMPRRDAPLRRVVALLHDARRRGARQLDIDGGEPTLYPALPRLIGAAKEAGFERVTLVTNARMAAYPSFVRRLRAAGLDAAAVTLLADRPELHDALSGAPGSFVEAARGIANLKAAGLELFGNVVLVPDNLEAAPPTARLLGRLGCRAVNLMFPVPLGRAARAGFRLPALAPLRRALVRAASHAGPARLVVHNLAPCLAPQAARRLEFAGSKQSTEMIFAHGSHVNFGRMLARLADYVPECAGCTERVACGGIWKRLLHDGVRPDPRFAGLPRRSP
ncbi:MAG: radical SAM protein [Deltaproteobacteria bacterium]|nr:radical SAM protein [Deltaproteobacteria bacterium]